MAVLLKVENLKAAYGGIHALRGVSLQVEEGEIVSVLGANGAGKSTLLKCISAVMKRAEGNIEFDGKPISNKPYEIVEAGLVQVPEARQIFAKLTVEENLRVGAGYRKDVDGIKKDFDRGSRASRSARSSTAAFSPAASSRCWPSPAASWQSPNS